MVSQFRVQWEGKLEFLLACMGYCVGLGNVWRFPYHCYKNGGGTFLIPYAVMLVIAAIPIFFMELCLGQFTSEGPVTAWRMAPIMSGIGWGMVLVSAMTCIYYNVVVMYSLFYTLTSLTSLGWDVPWRHCGNPWNDPVLCREDPLPDIGSISEDSAKIAAAKTIMDKTCVESLMQESFMRNVTSFNYSRFNTEFSKCYISYTLPSQEYWSRYVLEVNASSGIGDIGPVVSRNCLLLFLTWLCIFLCLWKGIRSVSKVVYFSATFPFLVMLILLVRGFTLSGFQEGVDFYTSPRWNGLWDPKVWSTAATQVFYSLGPCFGGLLTISSYNNFKHNIIRDAAIVALVNSITSIFGGLVTFSLLGTIAHRTNRPMDSIVDSGPELLFVVYPEGLAMLPAPGTWSFLFFLMVLTLGLDSQFMMMETVVSGLIDRFQEKLGNHRVKFLLACCMLGFILGIPQTTQGGIYVLIFFDTYCSSFGLLFVGLCELVTVAWIYGVRRFITDLELMLGKKPVWFWIYWVVTWKFLSPLSLFFIFVMFAVGYSPASYQSKVVPAWAEFFGWLMVIAPIFCVIGGALNEVVIKKIPFKQTLRPKENWGPRLEENRMSYYSNTRYLTPTCVDSLPRVPSDNSYRNITTDTATLEHHRNNPAFVPDSPDPCSSIQTLNRQMQMHFSAGN